MLLHDRPLVLVERAGLLEDPLRDPDLADVVQQGPDLDRLELVADEAEPARQRERDVATRSVWPPV